MAKALNLGLTAWSPLAGGVLTGKYHGHGSSEPGRMSSDMMKQFLLEQQRAERIVSAVKTVSDEVGRSMAQVGLAWLRYRPVAVIPIIGARKPKPAEKPAATQLLDINTATEEDLRALKGVGDIRAADITRNRPYKGKDELVQKKIIPAAVYAGIKDKIIAMPPIKLRTAVIYYILLV